MRAQWTRGDVKNVSRCAADEVARESSFVYAAEDARQLPQQTDAAHLGSALHHGQRQCLKDLRIGRLRSNRIGSNDSNSNRSSNRIGRIYSLTVNTFHSISPSYSHSLVHDIVL